MVLVKDEMRGKWKNDVVSKLANLALGVCLFKLR
jgi:hypothetical protein